MNTQATRMLGVTYLTARTKQYYQLSGAPEARADNLLIDFEGSNLVIRNQSEKTEDTYAFRASEVFLDGAVHFFEHTAGTGWGGSRPAVVQQVVVGATNDGRLAFVRVFDALGGPAPAFRPQQEILFSRGYHQRPSGDNYDPPFEGELVLEAGTAATLNPPDAADGHPARNEFPGIAYLSHRGATHYGRPYDEAQQAFGYLLTVSWTENHLEYWSKDAKGIYRRLPFRAQPFLNGHLRYYFFHDNPDPGEFRDVYRVIVLGTKADGSVGFMRTFDSLSNEFPPESLFPLPFDFFTSHDPSTYGRYNQELSDELGSVASLALPVLAPHGHTREQELAAEKR